MNCYAVSMHHTVIQKRLSNGISVVLVPLAGTAAVTFTVLMGVGSRYESDKQQGLAHFTEHLVFKGGKKYLSAEAVTQALDAVGGEFNAYTSYEFTGFYAKTASQHLQLGIDVLSDIVLHATFPQEEIEKEKGVIVEEINMYEDIPMRKVDHVLADLAYGDAPLGRPILGTKKTVKAFTRQDFLDYREQFYMGTQCVIAVAGAFDQDEIVEKVEAAFGEMPEGQPYRPAPSAILYPTSRVKVEEKKSEQAHLMLAVEAYAMAHPKRYAYRLLSVILGGNMSSRLFVSVREKQGLCYYVRAGADAYSDSGMFVVSAGVDNARLPQAVTAILKELSLIRDNPVPADELERAKQFLLGKTLLGMEDSEQVGEFYGMQQLLEGQLEEIEEMEHKLLAVTVEEVQEVAREIFQDARLRLAVIGPHEDASALERLLTFTS